MPLQDEYGHRALPLSTIAAALLVLTACVTVNVYFPAAAAERAADKLICEVYGVDCEGGDEEVEPATNDADAQPSDAQNGPTRDEASPALARTAMHRVTRVVGGILSFVVADAHAQQPDINIKSPAITALKSSMEARHQRLKTHYGSGAIGMSANGLLSLRDPAGVSLRDRNAVKKLIADENRDRNNLYREIAKANGHPEWENNIRGIFAKRWVAKAPSGWWFEQTPGRWAQK